MLDERAIGASTHWLWASAWALLGVEVLVMASVAVAPYPERPIRLIVPSAAGGGPLSEPMPQLSGPPR